MKMTQPNTTLAALALQFLIPRIRAESRKRHDRDLELVAYLRECDTVRFEASWDAAPPPSADVTARWSDFIRVELQPAELDWTQLGVVAIRDTGATNVVCFGGGPIVRTEYEANAAGAPDFERAVFHWWPVERPTKDGKGVEACALIELESTLPAAEKEAYLRRQDLLKDESEDDLTGFWYFFREEDLVPITVICFVAYILIRDAYYPRPENDIDYWDFTSGAWSEQTSPSGL